MTPVTTVSTSGRGGSWLLETTSPETILTHEKLTEEQKLIARTVDEFVTQEVLSVLDRLEAKDWNLARDLVKRCGDLGLLGTDVPEEYGGLGSDKATAL